MKLNTPREIINVLERALIVANTNMEMARLMVIASKHAIQALALEVMRDKLYSLRQESQNKPLEVLQSQVLQPSDS